MMHLNQVFCNCKKNSLVPQALYKSLEVGHNWDSCNAHIPVIIIL